MALLAVGALLGSTALAACGSDSSSGGTVSLNWYNGKEGWLPPIADACTKASNGAFKINVQDLPKNPDQQREQLVRRLAAKDSSIDIIGMDVIWPAEFAAAGWLRPYEGADRDELSKDVLDGPLQTGTYQDKLYGAPFTSNTQLLWYRKSRVQEPPKTWDELLKAASELPPDQRGLEMQGSRAERLTVLFNAVLESAGGQILENANEGSDAQVALQQEPTEKALTILRDAANSDVTPPSLDTATEDTNRQGFETGNSSFEINYPFVYPSAKEKAPDVFEDMGWARYPAVSADQPSKPPLGGYDLGISKYSKHPDVALEAVKCIRSADNQRQAALEGGQPPTLSTVYDSEGFAEEYPFGDILKESINDAAPRPVSPVYNGISLSVQRTLHPLGSINPQSDAKNLRDLVKKSLKSQALI